MRTLVLAALVSAAVAAPFALDPPSGPPQAATVQAGPGGVRYQPPVDAPVVDGFRPPSSPFGAGNRGIDYATEPGGAVLASADGQVVFAGAVAGHLHVVVLHADGVRTSYSFLASVTVRRGGRVLAGQEVGRSGQRLHFGARRGGAYIDPRSLFGPSGALRVHLVPDDGRSAPPTSLRR